MHSVELVLQDVILFFSSDIVTFSCIMQWEKPDELVLFEQQQQQQKLLLLQQQQQKLAVQQLQSPSQTQPHTQIPPNRQVSQVQQVAPQMQLNQPPQMQLLQPQLAVSRSLFVTEFYVSTHIFQLFTAFNLLLQYQASGVASQPNIQVCSSLEKYTFHFFHIRSSSFLTFTLNKLKY